MKIRFICLIASILLCGMFAAAQTTYENGPENDDALSWRFDGSRLFVSDSFAISGGTATINGISVWQVIFPTDHNPTAEITITSQPNSGTVYFDQTLQFSESNCHAAGWGYNWCVETASWTNGPALSNGTYWVTLKDGSVPSGAPVFWNQNAGVGCRSPGCPSQAEGVTGTIPSEAFTIMGTGNSESHTGKAPKTTGLLLFGSGFVGLVGLVRRRLG
ncbi:MAG: hypothetical protein WA655_24735 [Candidatus Korobacteraceae bacterium]